MKSVETIVSELIDEMEGPLKDTTEDDSTVASSQVDEKHYIFVSTRDAFNWITPKEDVHFYVKLVLRGPEGDRILDTATTKSTSREGLENAVHYLIGTHFGKGKTKDK